MSAPTTTFEKLKKAGACEGGYRKLAKSLGGIRKYGRTTPITLLQILDSNGLEDTLWVMGNGNVEGGDKMAHSFACDVAERVLHIYEKHVPGDTRPRKAIEIKRLWLAGKASDEELDAARDAARDAAGDASRDASWDAAGAAAWAAAKDADWAAAWVAAGASAWATAGAAARDAAHDWQEQRLRGYFEGDADKYVSLVLDNEMEVH